MPTWRRKRKEECRHLLQQNEQKHRRKKKSRFYSKFGWVFLQFLSESFKSCIGRMSESSTSLLNWKREEQWVSNVIEYSSQRNDYTGSAKQIIGPPKVYPRYGKSGGAWTLSRGSNNDFIIVEFQRAVYPERIDIYETFNPGAIVKVLVRNGTKRNESEWETVWETEAPQSEGRGGTRIFSIPCSNMSSREINQIRLDINCRLTNNWYQIDCIKLIGHLSHNDFFYQEMLINLKDLLTDDYLTDVTFQLDNGQYISSYRNILRLRCIYFHELFQEHSLNIKEPIRISNISSAAFFQILHFIFTDTIDSKLTIEIYLELMRQADEYFLSLIYTEALFNLKNLINKTNVFQIFMQSGLFPSSLNEQENILLTEVVDLCSEFIQKNRRDVYTWDNMQSLTREMLLQLIQLDQGE